MANLFKKISQITAVLILILTFSACGNKPRPNESALNDDLTEAELSPSDSMPSLHQVMGKETDEKLTAPVSSSSSSSSRSGNSDGYDNMRGFDPASEDDMDDNGMSRYMENDDEVGWD